MARKSRRKPKSAKAPAAPAAAERKPKSGFKTLGRRILARQLQRQQAAKCTPPSGTRRAIIPTHSFHVPMQVIGDDEKGGGPPIKAPLSTRGLKMKPSDVVTPGSTPAVSVKSSFERGIIEQVSIRNAYHEAISRLTPFTPGPSPAKTGVPVSPVFGMVSRAVALQANATNGVYELVMYIAPGYASSVLTSTGTTGNDSTVDGVTASGLSLSDVPSLANITRAGVRISYFGKTDALEGQVRVAVGTIEQGAVLPRTMDDLEMAFRLNTHALSSLLDGKHVVIPFENLLDSITAGDAWSTLDSSTTPGTYRPPLTAALNPSAPWGTGPTSNAFSPLMVLHFSTGAGVDLAGIRVDIVTAGNGMDTVGDVPSPERLVAPTTTLAQQEADTALATSTELGQDPLSSDSSFLADMVKDVTGVVVDTAQAVNAAYQAVAALSELPVVGAGLEVIAGFLLTDQERSVLSRMKIMHNGVAHPAVPLFLAPWARKLRNDPSNRVVATIWLTKVCAERLCTPAAVTWSSISEKNREALSLMMKDTPVSEPSLAHLTAQYKTDVAKILALKPLCA